ncbi:hypothetical protein CHUAL_007851 [Chamberlinius hualienensis]
MDFKIKLKQLINRQSTGSLTSPEQPISPTDTSLSSEDANSSSADQISKNEISRQNAEAYEEELLKSIESVYYNDEIFDAREYILSGLPDELNRDKIEADRRLLAKQLAVVSERVSRSILQKQTACVRELQTVYELQNSLKETLNVCRSTRRSLSCAMQQFTIASLGILSNYHKRQQLLGILRSLKMIKTLQQTDVRLKELLEEENYAGAINLCLECQKAVRTFRHYKCISDFSSKLQDTVEMIEEQLDQALAKVCSNFDANHYEKLQLAYRLLGKTQTAMDQLHMHFTTAIHNMTFSIVLGYVEQCFARSDANFHKRNYADLCKFITVDSFTSGLIDLCKVVWQIMHSYYRIMEWHSKYDAERVTEETAVGQGLGLEANFNLRYIQQKLETGLVRIWHDVQQKIKVYLLACDLSSFKFENFIQVLDIINRLIDIGEEFCGSKSDDLQESFRKQSVNYFRNYHRAYVEELRMFLENEGWELCPVKNDFIIFQLAEFKFLRQFKTSQTTPLASPAKIAYNGTKQCKSFFQKYYYSGNPFEMNSEEDDNEDVLPETVASGDTKFELGLGESDSSDSDVPDEIKQNYVDEKTGEYPHHREKHKHRNIKNIKGKQPILTNTTLNVLRLFGKYMQMMNILKPIAFDVVICMSQLFDYYMYAIYSFFVTDKETGEFVVGDKLQTTLRRIKENLIYDEMAESSTGAHRLKDKVPKPNLSPVVDLNSEDSLFGLGARVVAAESLVFLAEQLKLIQSHLELLIPQTKRTFLQQFYSYTVCMASEVRSPVYTAVAIRAIRYEQILEKMATVRWDVTELMSQHSPYVDSLLREMQLLSMRISEVGKEVPIPKEASDVLWVHCIRLTIRTFVEGFSVARKCSNEGRALMQLDFQQFLMKLEKITDLSPIPDKEYAENYIKAFYLPESNLENWIIAHKVY